MSTKNRQFKINWMQSQLRRFFERNPEETISISRLVASFAIELNSTDKTGREILRQLAEIGFIKIEDGNITALTV